MSVAKKRKPYAYPTAEAMDRQEHLRLVKLEAERLTEKLKSNILENPKAAKKAALLISLWIEGKSRKK